jgi:hypothetical protein
MHRANLNFVDVNESERFLISFVSKALVTGATAEGRGNPLINFI